MNHHLFLLTLILLIVSSCNPSTPGNEEVLSAQMGATDEPVEPKVTGIGGIFYKSQDPAAAKAWYGDNLGMAVDDFGAPFEFRNAHRPEEKNYLNWDAFPDTTSYFNPSASSFMINYRVQNIEGLVDKLKEKKVTILDEIVTYPYGKFVHILDLEGNKIELWEPVDSVLETMGRETTK